MRVIIVLMPFPPHEPETAECIKKAERAEYQPPVLLHVPDSVRHEISCPAFRIGKSKTLHAVHDFRIVGQYREETFSRILSDAPQVHVRHPHSGAYGRKLCASHGTFVFAAEHASEIPFQNLRLPHEYSGICDNSVFRPACSVREKPVVPEAHG